MVPKSNDPAILIRVSWGKYSSKNRLGMHEDRNQKGVPTAM